MHAASQLEASLAVYRQHDGTQALQAHGELAPRAQPAQRSPEDPLQVEWLNLQALNTSDTMYITIVAISRPLSHKTAGATQAAVQRVDIIELEATGRATCPRRRGRLCPCAPVPYGNSHAYSHGYSHGYFVWFWGFERTPLSRF